MTSVARQPSNLGRGVTRHIQYVVFPLWSGNASGAGRQGVGEGEGEATRLQSGEWTDVKFAPQLRSVTFSTCTYPDCFRWALLRVAARRGRGGAARAGAGGVGGGGALMIIIHTMDRHATTHHIQIMCRIGSASSVFRWAAAASGEAYK